jgi:uncharacterized RDD family membrane protein YckC
MVIHDIGSLDTKKNQSASLRAQLGYPSGDIGRHIASPGDRLLACFLDFLILGPTVGLFTAIYLRDLRSYVYYDTSGGTEAMVTFLMMAFIGILAISLTQALFLTLTGATPGQRFLYLRVVGYEPFAGQPIRFSQALLRSFSWWLGAPLLFVPLLEILSHPLRRAFYDRVSDTIVVCLKKKNSRPQLAETQLISSWMQMFGLGLFAILVMFLHRLEEKTLEGHWTLEKSHRDHRVCESIDIGLQDIPKRLDQALSMYFVATSSKTTEAENTPEDDSSEDQNEVEKAKGCLEREADFALWQRQKKYHPLAYLAKGILVAKSEHQRPGSPSVNPGVYDKFICINQNSEECVFIRYLREKSATNEESLRKSGLRMNASRVILMQEAIKQNNFSSALALVDDLMENPDLTPLVSKAYIQLIWKIQMFLSQEENPQLGSLQGERKPASDNPNQERLKEAVSIFKEKFQIE